MRKLRSHKSTPPQPSPQKPRVFVEMTRRRKGTAPKPRAGLSNNSNPSAELSNGSRPRAELSNDTNPSVELPDSSRPRAEFSNDANPSIELPDGSRPRAELSNDADPSIELPNSSRPRAELSNDADPSIELPNGSRPCAELSNDVDPSVELPNGSRPRAELPNDADPSIELPNGSRPRAELSNDADPSVELPNGSRPRAELSNNADPSIELPNGSRPRAELSNDADPSIELPNGSCPRAELSHDADPSIELPNGSRPRAELSNDADPSTELPNGSLPYLSNDSRLWAEDSNGNARPLAEGPKGRMRPQAGGSNDNVQHRVHSQADARPLIDAHPRTDVRPPINRFNDHLLPLAEGSDGRVRPHMEGSHNDTYAQGEESNNATPSIEGSIPASFSDSRLIEKFRKYQTTLNFRHQKPRQSIAFNTPPQSSQPYSATPPTPSPAPAQILSSNVDTTSHPRPRPQLVQSSPQDIAFQNWLDENASFEYNSFNRNWVVGRSPWSFMDRHDPPPPQPALRRSTRRRPQSHHQRDGPDARETTESSDSDGSNYSDARREIASRRRKLAEQGKDHSDTEREDEEDDRNSKGDMSNDALPSKASRIVKQKLLKSAGQMADQQRAGQTAERQLAGQTVEGQRAGQIVEGQRAGRTVEGQWTSQAVETQRAGQTGLSQPSGKNRDDGVQPSHRGRYSIQAIKEIEEFAEATRKRAQDLAHKYGRSMTDILIRAGLGMREMRSSNAANEHRQWYYLTHPKDTRPPAEVFARKQLEDYRKLMEGVDQTDPTQVATVMAPIREELDLIDSDSMNDRQTSVALMKKAKNALGSMAKAYNRGGGIEIVGAVLYTGTDTVPQQISCIFSGSEMARKLIDEHEIAIKALLDRLTTAFKSKKLNDTGLSQIANLFTKAKAIVESDSETELQDPWTMPEGCSQRDHYRRLAGHILLERLNALLEKRLKKMRWKNWNKTAIDAKLVLVNWPDSVKPPGVSFNARTMPMADFKLICNGWIVNRDNPGSEAEIEIHRWNVVQRNFSITSADYGNVPLVIGQSGNVLVKISDTGYYQPARPSKRLPEPLGMDPQKRSRTNAYQSSSVTPGIIHYRPELRNYRSNLPSQLPGSSRPLPLSQLPGPSQPPSLSQLPGPSHYPRSQPVIAYRQSPAFMYQQRPNMEIEGDYPSD